MSLIGQIKVFILDDHQVLIDGIKALLKNEPDIVVNGEANLAIEALSLIQKNIPHIVLCDISLPGLSGIEFTKKIKLQFPDIKILALSMHGEKDTILEMIEAGASGYLLKNTGKEEMIRAIKKVAEGKVYLSDDVSVEMMKALNEKSKPKEEESKIRLTDREIEIIRYIAKEYSNAQIAEKLFISERTVETHRKNIFRKVEVRTPVGLIKYAIENNLLSE